VFGCLDPSYARTEEYFEKSKLMRIGSHEISGCCPTYMQRGDSAAGVLKHEMSFRDSYSSFEFRSFAKLDTEIVDGAGPGT